MDVMFMQIIFVGNLFIGFLEPIFKIPINQGKKFCLTEVESVCNLITTFVF